MPKGIITPLERKEALMAEFKRRPKAPFFSAKELGITIDSEALEEWRKHR